MGVSDVLYAQFVAILDECRILGDIPACRGSFSEKRRHLPDSSIKGEVKKNTSRTAGCFLVFQPA